MASYIIIAAQLVLLVVGLCLFAKAHRAQRSLVDREQIADLAKLYSALNELLDELKETAKKTNEELVETNAKAHQLIQQIDERLKSAGQDGGVAREPKSVLASWGEAAYQRHVDTRHLSAPDGVDPAVNEARRSRSSSVAARPAVRQSGGDRASTVRFDRESLAALVSAPDATVTAADIARQWRTGRGEVELIQHLQRWHRQ